MVANKLQLGKHRRSGAGAIQVCRCLQAAGRERCTASPVVTPPHPLPPELIVTRRTSSMSYRMIQGEEESTSHWQEK